MITNLFLLIVLRVFLFGNDFCFHAPIDSTYVVYTDGATLQYVAVLETGERYCFDTRANTDYYIQWYQPNKPYDLIRKDGPYTRHEMYFPWLTKQRVNNAAVIISM